MYRSKFAFKALGQPWHYRAIETQSLAHLLRELRRLECWARNQGYTFQIFHIQKG